MNKRDLIFIVGIAIALLAAVSGFEVVLRGVPEAAPAMEEPVVAPSLSVRARSNTRAGDSREYPVRGQLQVGETATILGVSTGSAGWYFIELPDGTRGFISPDIVETKGDLTNLEKIDPSYLNATATPQADSAQPAATAGASEEPDEAQQATPTASG